MGLHQGLKLNVYSSVTRPKACNQSISYCFSGKREKKEGCKNGRFVGDMPVRTHRATVG
jgi:hypothetical protein